MMGVMVGKSLSDAKPSPMQGRIPLDIYWRPTPEAEKMLADRESGESLRAGEAIEVALENDVLTDYASNCDFVRAVHRKMLHRDPAVDDPKGPANWTGWLDRGATRAWVLWRLATSQESMPGYAPFKEEK
jgi:hypothetical protein